MRVRAICRALALGVAMTMASLDAAAGISYQVVDLVDPDGGPDTRRIDYRIDNSTPSLYGYTLYFHSSLFADIEALSDADWFASTVQPVPDVALDGLVDALALAELAAGASFSVRFTWLGTGETGAQAYTMFDDAFNVIDSGQTRLALPTSDVPEPASAALVLAGLAALVRQRRHVGQARR